MRVKRTNALVGEEFGKFGKLYILTFSVIAIGCYYAMAGSFTFLTKIPLNKVSD